LIIGYDHRFGKDRQGDPDVLKKCAARFGIEVIKVDEYKIEGEEVSSTKIRKALEQGRIEHANNLLGYRYTFEGHVISGNKIGRTLGFPTANIEPADPEKLIPHKGVYDVELIIRKKCYRGMLNIGTRATVSNQIHTVLEVHLFDFSRNIYRENVTILFNRFIREEKKFLNTEHLKEQLEIDKKMILQK
jgi:riboflavin kinase/FMN adenylyltransferase